MTVREPKQKRSIEKKRRIIEAGFKLFCEKGFHNTNTAEIAKAAGVSTGIVYSYFLDKNDIFLSAIDLYGQLITAPVYDRIASIKPPFSFRDVLEDVIDSLIYSHKFSKNAHEEMMAMFHTNPAAAALLTEFDLKLIKDLTTLLISLGFESPFLVEKVHIAHKMIESYCHEIIYSPSENYDYSAMREIIVSTIENIFITSENPESHMIKGE